MIAPHADSALQRSSSEKERKEGRKEGRKDIREDVVPPIGHASLEGVAVKVTNYARPFVRPSASVQSLASSPFKWMAVGVCIRSSRYRRK